MATTATSLPTTTQTPDPGTTASDETRRIEGLPFHVIGLGGIGEYLVPSLSRFLWAQNAGNTVWLMDGDEFEARNKARMSFSELGSKAEARTQQVAALYGDRVSFRSLPVYVDRDNITELIPPDEAAVILLACDNHPTRRLLAEYCEERTEGLTLLISGGNSSVEEDGGHTGNVLVYHREGARCLTNSPLTHHPEIAGADESDMPSNDDEDCLAAAMRQGGEQLGLTNAMVACVMMNALYAWFRHGRTDYEEVYLDVLRNSVTPRQRPVVSRST